MSEFFLALCGVIVGFIIGHNVTKEPRDVE